MIVHSSGKPYSGRCFFVKWIGFERRYFGQMESVYYLSVNLPYNVCVEGLYATVFGAIIPSNQGEL